MELTKRSMDEMIANFNREVSCMDLFAADKIKILGMLTAIGFRYKEDVQFVHAIPTAKPEIIRCKDCKHWIPYDWMFSEVWQSKNIADYPEDEIGCNLCGMAMKANDFCSRGERRTE